MLSSDDVVDLMGQDRCVLRKAAVLACPLGAPLDQLSRVAREPHEAARMAQSSSA